MAAEGHEPSVARLSGIALECRDQPNPGSRVFADPAGHPFRLCG